MSDSSLARRPGRALVASLWFAQAFICVAFAIIAAMKLGLPIPRLAAMWPWTGQLPEPVVRLLGLIDLAGGLGILLPTLTRVRPGLAVTAAACCVALQVCATIFHASRGEFAALPVNAVFLVVCVFVLWGRWKAAPVHGRAG